MSRHQESGQVTANGQTDGVVCSGFVTMTAHLSSGSGTWTWQFNGPDGVWRSIYGGNDGTIEQSYTGSHMINAYFGNDVEIRGSASSSSSPEWNWQLISNPRNRI